MCVCVCVCVGVGVGVGVGVCLCVFDTKSVLINYIFADLSLWIKIYVLWEFILSVLFLGCTAVCPPKGCTANLCPLFVLLSCEDIILPRLKKVFLCQFNDDSDTFI